MLGPDYYFPLLVIFFVSSTAGIFIINNLLDFETINQDLNPVLIQRKRREEKLIRLVERKASLLLELDDKKTKLEELVSTISDKFEKIKGVILLAISEFEMLSNRDAYFSKYDHHNWFENWRKLEPVVDLFFSLEDIPITYLSEMRELQTYLTNGEEIINKRNQKYIQQELKKHHDYFETLETYPLTLKQREAIIIDEHRNLVIAGAGTGKTSTIIGKTGYLLRKEAVKPEEILLLSFGRDPKKEMNKRLQERFGLALDVNTFHGLGMKIIAEAKNEKPLVSVLSTDQIKLQHFIGKVIDENRSDNDFIKNLNKFFLSQTEYKSLWDFKTLGEYYSHLRENQIRSLKGDQVKSYEELEIANWLYLNGVDYEYEHRYEYRTTNKLYGQYKPDFYLPDYEIYIEHFGVDRVGNTAPCIPKNRYLQEMDWKREIHQQHNTKLIETYSYERMEGNLTEKLLIKLQDHDVKIVPISQDQIFTQLNEMGIIQPIYGLLATFLNLYKSSTLDLYTLRVKSRESENPNRSITFLEVFTRIEKAYEEYLRDNNEIDFNDMIKKATEYLVSEQVVTNFKYVLVDEFQDISQSRNQLLSVLVNQNPNCKLFCVGDDWQSIYRFTGSDLNIMTNFEEYYPYSLRLSLDETFRFNNQLSELSTKFILQNPIQITKQLKSRTSSDNPAVTVVHADDPKEELTKLLTKLNEEKGSVYILGRYNRDNPYIKKYYGNLVIEFHTAHKSKGTQTDYSIISLQAGKMGFPCEIVDDPVLNLVLSKQDTYSNSEERRLFYVALTRAKKHVYLISNKNNPSDFIKELTNGDYHIEEIEIPETGNPKCPRCQTGNIVTRDNVYGRFYACNNYPYCEYIAPRCTQCKSGYMLKSRTIYECSECGHRALACPECKEGIRVLRNGKYSNFYGCTNYPDCTYKYSTRNRKRKLFYVS